MGAAEYQVHGLTTELVIWRNSLQQFRQLQPLVLGPSFKGLKPDIGLF